MVLFLLNQLCLKMDHRDYYNTDKFQSIESGIQVANLGSSHGLYGFCYEDLPQYKTFNFALISQTLSYDYRILLEYGKCLQEDGILLIPVSYFSFYGDRESDQEDFETKNKRYYKFLSKDNIKNYDVFYHCVVKEFPVLDQKDSFFPVLLGAAENKNDATWNRNASDIDISLDAQNAYKRHFLENHGDEKRNPEEIQALKDIIGFCKNNKVIPVMITTPYLKEYTELVSPEFFEDFYGIIREIQAETGAAYYDYAKDGRFKNNYALFMNSDHLNKAGAKKFVEIITEEIIQKKIKQKYK